MAGGAKVIEVPVDIRDGMVAHAQREFPDEACGLLAGPDGRIEELYAMQNADRSPVTYRLDPRDQLVVFNEMESKGLNLAAIYHSHTRTRAYPSETDRRQAFYPEAYYIVLSLQDRANPVIRGFTIRDGVIEEQEVRVK